MAMGTGHGFWQRILLATDEESFRRIEVRDFSPLRLGTPWQALLGVDDGRPLLAVRPVQRGTLFLSGLPFEPKATSLPLTSTFLPLAQGLTMSTAENAAGRPLEAGRQLTLPTTKGAIVLRSLCGDSLEWQGEAKDVPPLPRDGILQLREGEDETLIHIVTAADESKPQCLSTAETAALREVTVIAPGPIPEWMQAIESLRRGLDLHKPLLLLALILLGLEALLGSRPLLEAKRRKASQASNTGLPLALGIEWNPLLSTWESSLLILLVGILLWRVWGRLQERRSRHEAGLLLFPKAALFVLLLLALFNPAQIQRVPTGDPIRLLALLDHSDSMETVDHSKGSRRERTALLLDHLKKSLPRTAQLDTIQFGQPDGAKQIAEPLPAAAVGQLLQRRDLTRYTGIVLLTDGGDEPLVNPVLPPVPLHILGVGSAPKDWQDLAVTELSAPASVEKGAEVPISVELRAHRGQSQTFHRQLEAVEVLLEMKTPEGQWVRLDASTLNLKAGRARAPFRVQADALGRLALRASVTGLTGELSTLNNEAQTSVEVRKSSLHILYYSRSLGMGFRWIRRELARDPGLRLTAMIRTLGERFTLQGARREGDEALEAGFPAEADALKPYACIILGSFPAQHWHPGQLKALKGYVEGGGGLLVLGGEHSFQAGGYEGTALAQMLPWRSAGRGGLQRGSFSVEVPTTAAHHPILEGITDGLAQSQPVELASINQGLRPRATATLLLQSHLQGRTAPVVALHPFGLGRVMGVATNTLWRWSKRPGTLSQIHSRLWRQSVRYLAGSDETGRRLSVQWSRDRYHPGETGTATLRVHGVESTQGLGFHATLTAEETTKLQALPLPGNAYRVTVPFLKRGEAIFHLQLTQNGTRLEDYERRFHIGDGLREGSRLEVDEEGLQRLAESTGGTYFHEEKRDAWLQAMTALARERVQTQERSLTAWHGGGPYLLAAFLLLLTIEWTLRRRLHLT
ncbi:MAG: glutamine amidotransferase [Planctomycetota bacterium]|jgi:uncharacterized membrane protein